MGATVRSLQEKLIGILVFVTITVFFSGTYTGLQSIGLYVLTPLLFVVSIFQYRNHLGKIKKELAIYFLFTALALLSFFYPNFHTQAFLNTFPKVVASFMSGFIAIALN